MGEFFHARLAADRIDDGSSACDLLEVGIFDLNRHRARRQPRLAVSSPYLIEQRSQRGSHFVPCHQITLKRSLGAQRFALTVRDHWAIVFAAGRRVVVIAGLAEPGGFCIIWPSQGGD